MMDWRSVPIQGPYDLCISKHIAYTSLRLKRFRPLPNRDRKLWIADNHTCATLVALLLQSPTPPKAHDKLADVTRLKVSHKSPPYTESTVSTAQQQAR